jgi:hypothetical protein
MALASIFETNRVRDMQEELVFLRGALDSARSEISQSKDEVVLREKILFLKVCTPSFYVSNRANTDAEQSVIHSASRRSSTNDFFLGPATVLLLGSITSTRPSIPMVSGTSIEEVNCSSLQDVACSRC